MSWLLSRAVASYGSCGRAITDPAFSADTIHLPVESILLLLYGVLLDIQRHKVSFLSSRWN